MVQRCRTGRLREATPSWLARFVAAALVLAAPSARGAEPGAPPGKPIEFDRDIRPILSNKCFACHGPDKARRKAGLRLDTPEGAVAPSKSGERAVVAGDLDQSELFQRITAEDDAQRMPPKNSGKTLEPAEIERLRSWIEQGGRYTRHWSLVPPTRPKLPSVRDRSWCANPIDSFILARLETEGLRPSAEGDRAVLIRRLYLDLTGLPPALDEVDRFLAERGPDAYERVVDRILADPAYGEHWGRMWLDLARYADSAGYADDPLRTIWAYRDYVVRSFNANTPFDQFTIEQLAGDLLPNPTLEQLIATAFHRNTLTNNEGGTDDEEFRNIAVVDRVNTTMAVWLGATMACAQCHDHKYDPFTQQEYFRLFAFFNNTRDADRTDESPTLPIYSDQQKAQKANWQREVDGLEATLGKSTLELEAGQARWEHSLAAEPAWQPLEPASASSRSGTKLSVRDDRSIFAGSAGKTDVYTVTMPLSGLRLTALRLEALPDEALPSKGPGYAGGNFVVSRLLAAVAPPVSRRKAGRYVRIELPGQEKILSLAEVQVYEGEENVARGGEARQSSVAFDGPAARAIDGNTDGRYEEAKSTTHTEVSDDPWWEVDLKRQRPVDRILIWNRTDNGLHTRLAGFRIILLNDAREPVWTEVVQEPPNPSVELAPGGARPVVFTFAAADYAQPSFEAASVINNKDVASKGWAIADKTGHAHALTLVPAAPVEFEPGSTLSVKIEQLFAQEQHTLGRFRIAVTDDERATEFARTLPPILAILKVPPDGRTDAQRTELARYYRTAVAPELRDARERLAHLRKQLAELKPVTTVPILRELDETARRKTRIQHRGNFLDVGDEVTPGVPAALHALPAGAPPDRLTLARWLVAEENPLTARVVANRYWEQLFGIGLVATSEEFGTQGERPSHPELLDWLATELVRLNWDLKRFVRLLVTSAAYRQDSRVEPEKLSRDPDNRLVARGPRCRLPAETVRDQALAVSGLLSATMFGPPVRPPQPKLGVTAAFGSGIDWEPSTGQDRYRRGVYTTWRRSNPYPSMATFDAPNREICTIRRMRTNTPLQALVTLNDPVYVEAAQALARRIARGGSSPSERAGYGFRLCLDRPPTDPELVRLVRLYEHARAAYAGDPESARAMVGESSGPIPKDADVADLAAWTVVANVLLNLDEMLMRR
jgi:hypothetical protein